MKKIPRISEGEWLVMKAVWEKSPCPAQEVMARLAGKTDWSAATVKTLLNRLVKKQALRFAREGKAYWYSPAYDAEQLRSAEAESFLRRIFDGALTPLVAHFVRSRKLSAAELAELERILRAKKKEL
ncbi:MAG: BlaI/MecI/CopY family transcriptional regulator [Verrucomicrobiales bacterium]|jgi:BlaI family penicillinase repressor|nr:BlaI/MecI/CopY family transcriptional regulator [Verrucomicrobiales bacterium]